MLQFHTAAQQFVVKNEVKARAVSTNIKLFERNGNGMRFCVCVCVCVFLCMCVIVCECDVCMCLLHPGSQLLVGLLNP